MKNLSKLADEVRIVEDGLRRLDFHFKEAERNAMAIRGAQDLTLARALGETVLEFLGRARLIVAEMKEGKNAD